MIAAVILVSLMIAACSKPEEEEPEPLVPVQTAAVHRDTIRRIIQAEAILYPADQAAVMPKISSPVQKFYVNRGDHVRKGQLLAELESRDLAAAVVEARGNYDEAVANYRNTTRATLPEEMAKSQREVQSNKEALDAAQKVYESRKKLFQEGALARKQLDEAEVAFVQARNQYEISVKHLQSLQEVGRETQSKAAQAQVEAARGRLSSAEAQLQYSRITSPLDGVVAERPLYEGETVSAGSALITVMDISSVIARAAIPVNELRFLKVGETATISAPNASTIQGKVTVVSPALDPNSTTAEVWVRAPNPGERLRPGSTVQAAIVAETIQDALVIPASAILPSQQETTVLVVEPDSLAHERKIQTGVREGDRVQVLRGLEAGEQVITVGGFGVQDKTKVRIEKNPEQEK